MGSLWVRKTPASAATVRHSIAVDIQRAGFGRDVADDAALLASELVGNSIRHATALPSGYLEVAWSVDATGIRLQVTDGGGPHKPLPRQARFDDTSGRGLTIVAAVADDWGVEESAESTTVWAHLATATSATATSATATSATATSATATSATATSATAPSDAASRSARARLPLSS